MTCPAMSSNYDLFSDNLVEIFMFDILDFYDRPRLVFSYKKILNILPAIWYVGKLSQYTSLQ